MNYKNRDKKKKQEEFLGVCKVCGAKMKYIQGTNVVVCSNESCRGYFSNKGNTDSEVQSERVVARLLTGRQSSYANRLFGD